MARNHHGADRVSDQPTPQPIAITLDPAKWQHRLVINQGAPEGQTFAAGAFDAQIGAPFTVFIHGEDRSNYFLSEVEVSRDGKAVLMTLDFYDLTEDDIQQAIAKAKVEQGIDAPPAVVEVRHD